MLQPSEQTVLFDALQPPAGYRLDRAVAGTFSLDLVALLSIPLAFSLAPGETDESVPERADPALLLESVRRVAERLTVFCQAGQIGVPRQQHPLLALLEPCITEVRAPRGGLFHPKVWVLRYHAEETGEQPILRALIGSRNLTFDRSWDTALVLEGVEGSRAVTESRPLARFLEALPGMALVPHEGGPDDVGDLADSVVRTSFAPPGGFAGLRFLPLGHTTGWLRENPILDEPRRHVMVVSPFLGDDLLGRVANGASGAVLVSRREALDGLASALPAVFGKTLALDEGALPEQAAEDALVGLHAKLYAVEHPRGHGHGVTLWTGSANATSEAFSRNVELMVGLLGDRTSHGIAALLGDGTSDTLRALLVPHEPGGGPPEEDTDEQVLEGLRRAIGDAPLRLVATDTVQDDQLHLELHLDGPALPAWPPGTSVTIRPLASPPQTERPYVGSATGRLADFGDVSVEGLTAYLVVTVTSGERRLAFVRLLPLEGGPADRFTRIARRLLGDRDAVLRFLLMLLGVAPGDGMASRTAHGTSGDAAGPSPPAAPLLEQLVRALHHEPDRLVRIKELVTTFSDDGLLPDDVVHIWTALVRSARGQELLG